MKIHINQASPVIEKHSSFHYSIVAWSVSGKYIPDCDCSALAKPFDIYIAYDKLKGDKQEILQLTKNKLEEDGKDI